MKIEVLKIYKNKDKTDTDLVFIDKDVKEIVGHCNYSVINKEGLIYDTYLFPKYRNKGIMKLYINDILCDMKCMGALKVKLNTSSNEICKIWKTFGFNKINENRSMEIDISNKKCKCLSNLHTFLNEIDMNTLTNVFTNHLNNEQLHL